MGPGASYGAVGDPMGLGGVDPMGKGDLMGLGEPHGAGRDPTGMRGILWGGGTLWIWGWPYEAGGSIWDSGGGLYRVGGAVWGWGAIGGCLGGAAVTSGLGVSLPGPPCVSPPIPVPIQSVPFLGYIFGGLSRGRMVIIQGQVRPKAQRWVPPPNTPPVPPSTPQ